MFRPNMVGMSRAEDFVSIEARDEQQFRHLRLTGAFGHIYSWIASDINPAGAVGNATLAAVEKGNLIAEVNVVAMPLPSTRYTAATALAQTRESPAGSISLLGFFGCGSRI
ncbi:MAG: hypothetical protein MO846_03205 [Candidatus Devosia symbiotica]|nr:hypothetical protein [Candidatus Devosia symbiotica]